MNNKALQAQDLISELKKKGLSNLEIAQQVTDLILTDTESLKIKRSDNNKMVKLKRQLWTVCFFYIQKHYSALEAQVILN